MATSLPKTSSGKALGAYLVGGRLRGELEELADRLVAELGREDAEALQGRAEELASALYWALEQTAPKLPDVEAAGETRTVGRVTYRQELVRCGKRRCKCERGELHGPYWYAYFTRAGTLRKKYIGKRYRPLGPKEQR